MDEQIKKRLLDIIEAIARINIHLKYCNNFKEYSANITVKAAVERELGIIGEAVNQVKKVSPEIQLSGMQKNNFF